MDQQAQPLKGNPDSTNTQPGSHENTARDKERRNFERNMRELRNTQCHFQAKTRRDFQTTLFAANTVLGTVLMRLRTRATIPALGLLDWLVSQLQRLRISLVKASFLDEDD